MTIDTIFIDIICILGFVMIAVAIPAIVIPLIMEIVEEYKRQNENDNDN